MENEAHLICEEDFRLGNFDNNKEIPAMAEFRSGDLKWMVVHRIVIEWNKELNDIRFWDKRPTPGQRIETPWPDGGFSKRCDAVDLDSYINTLPDPQTLREKILSWFSDTSDRVKMWANTKLKGHNYEN